MLPSLVATDPASHGDARRSWCPRGRTRSIRDEPGTLQHDWFFSDDGGRCVIREAYASSDAFLAHLAGAGPLLGRLVELGGGLELEVFGEPSTPLRDAIAAFQPRIYSYSQSK